MATDHPPPPRAQAAAAQQPPPCWLPPVADAHTALAVFDALAPVQDLLHLRGTWRGQGWPTGHPLDGVLEAYGWWGKRVDGEDAVHPLLFTAGNGVVALRAAGLVSAIPLLLRWPWLRSRPAARVLRHLLRLLATRRSQARVRLVAGRGSTSATLVYDHVPILDLLRRVDDDTVLGLMDLKGMEQPLFFVLHRVAGEPVPPP